MNDLSLLSVKAAQQEILARMGPLPPCPVSIDAALGLVLSEDIRSTENLPPFPNSAMDGFAVRVADVASASRENPVRLNILADAPAGTVVHCEVIPGTAVRIMTGAELPPGTEGVVPVEHTTSSSSDVVIHRAIRKGGNLRLAGEDVRAGEVVVAKGTVVRAAEVGLLAAIGRASIPVFPVPRVAVMTTGAELVAVDHIPGPGQIRDANIHALCAQVRAAGADPLAFPRVADRREAVEASIRKALQCSDVLLTNGGISAGDYDFLKEALDGMGARQVFCQVAQKPGRPMAFWILGGKPVFGLPGNPVAAMVCFEMYVRPALRRIMGHAKLFRPRVQAELADDYPKSAQDPRTHFLRVHARLADGLWTAAATGPQGSGILSSMTQANAIAEIPATAGALRSGDAVSLHLVDLREDH